MCWHSCTGENARSSGKSLLSSSLGKLYYPKGLILKCSIYWKVPSTTQSVVTCSSSNSRGKGGAWIVDDLGGAESAPSQHYESIRETQDRYEGRNRWFITPLIKRRIPLEVELFTGDAIKEILFDVEMTFSTLRIWTEWQIVKVRFTSYIMFYYDCCWYVISKGFIGLHWRDELEQYSSSNLPLLFLILVRNERECVDNLLHWIFRTKWLVLQFGILDQFKWDKVSGRRVLINTICLLGGF